MDPYKQMLNDLIRSNKDTIISNGNGGHASALIEKLFEVADKSVHILAGHQDIDIYASSSAINAAVKFLQSPESKMTVILEDSDSERLDLSAKKLFHALHSKLGNPVVEKVSIYKLNESTKIKPFHYMLVDDRAFRFAPNKQKHEALAAFNNKTAAANIMNSALTLLKHAAHIDTTKIVH